MSRYDKQEACQELSPEAIQSEVERILASEKFARSKRLRSLLRFTVAQTLQGNADTLKEYVIGTEVLKKPDSYDPRSDSLVRVLASRLRVKLKEYYSDGGSEDPLVIEFPKGKYVPRFQRREQLQTEIEKKLRARQACSLGRFLTSKLDESYIAEAAQHFEEATEADPNWPSAHEALANLYALQAFLGLRRPREVWPLVRAQAEAALQLDEMSAEAHIALGMVNAFFEWRWRDAEVHFQKAIDRDSYSASGHLWRAVACLLPMGKMAEAQEELGKVQDLSRPPFTDEARALTLFFSGRFDEIATQSGQGTWFPGLFGCALAADGRTAEAIEMLERLRAQHPGRSRIIANLGYVYGITGKADAACEMLAALRERRMAGHWVPNYDLAIVEAGLGDQNEVLAMLQEALREKEPFLAFLAVDPRLSSVRDLPKFTGILRRVVLTENEESREQTA